MIEEIVLSTRAIHDFQRLPKDIQKRIKKKLNEFKQNPSRFDIKKLKGIDGGKDLFRLRIGDYRLTYHPDGNIVRIIRIDHRRKDYKWLE